MMILDSGLLFWATLYMLMPVIEFNVWRPNGCRRYAKIANATVVCWLPCKELVNPILYI